MQKRIVLTSISLSVLLVMLFFKEWLQISNTITGTDLLEDNLSGLDLARGDTFIFKDFQARFSVYFIPAMGIIVVLVGLGNLFSQRISQRLISILYTTSGVLGLIITFAEYVYYQSIPTVRQNRIDRLPAWWLTILVLVCLAALNAYSLYKRADP